MCIRVCDVCEYVCVCECVMYMYMCDVCECGMHVPLCTYRSQKATLWTGFSPFTLTWILGVEPRPAGLHG